MIFSKYGYKLKSRHVEIEVVSVSEDEFVRVKYFDWQLNAFGQPFISLTKNTEDSQDYD